MGESSIAGLVVGLGIIIILIFIAYMAPPTGADLCTTGNNLTICHATIWGTLK
ncbi:MAG: Mid2-like cell wall stress sensor [Siphoviridae sp. ctjeG17]|nr:MAG: Mid2-like cell wall stress sensor [Siphoviridae sp. ctjeG17]